MKQSKSLQHIIEKIGSFFLYKKALFAVSSLGLGHATRTLPLIQYYAALGFHITLISHGNALRFLRNELDPFSSHIVYYDIGDYPPLERGMGWKMYSYLFYDLWLTRKLIHKERDYTASLGKKFDFVFSDGRYGVFLKGVPSYLLSHQISFVLPKFLTHLKKIGEGVNLHYFKRFTHIFIPDYESEKDSLAGELSHTPLLKNLSHSYVGPLSSYLYEDDGKKDIDYYFIISGYLEEQKQSFIHTLVEQAKGLPGKKIFVLGDTSRDFVKEYREYNLILYSSVSSQKRLDFFKRAYIIISRSGYTTIMDIIENKKKALLFPTLNQTEQEYLALYGSEKGLFVNGRNDPEKLQELLGVFR